MIALTATQRLHNMTAQKDLWKARAQACETRPHLPGRKQWSPRVERWRGLLAACFDGYCQQSLGREATDYEVDMGLGIIAGESGGDHLAICKVEWIGPEPPGYNPADPSTRATGLCQHVPAYWEGRSRAALGRPGNILDPVDQLLVMGYLVYHNRAKAPNWGHWPDAPNGQLGSASKAKLLLAPLYSEAERL
jgi:hypothetical protein